VVQISFTAAVPSSTFGGSICCFTLLRGAFHPRSGNSECPIHRLLSVEDIQPLLERYLVGRTLVPLQVRNSGLQSKACVCCDVLQRVPMNHQAAGRCFGSEKNHRQFSELAVAKFHGRGSHRDATANSRWLAEGNSMAWSSHSESYLLSLSRESRCLIDTSQVPLPAHSASTAALTLRA
jgi:hypothetical protein